MPTALQRHLRMETEYKSHRFSLSRRSDNSQRYNLVHGLAVLCAFFLVGCGAAVVPDSLALLLHHVLVLGDVTGDAVLHVGHGADVSATVEAAQLAIPGAVDVGAACEIKRL